MGSMHPYNQVVLNNGLTLLAVSQPHAAVVTADIWIKSGARFDPDAYQGVSHFLEHLVFKGTERLKPGQFDALIEAKGGATNAATSMDFTHYYITVAREDLSESLPLLADLVCHPAIPESDFDPERLVVLEEIRRANDNPDQRIYRTLAQSLYPEHPYGRAVLGTPEHLQGLTADWVRDFHRRQYAPSQMTVILVGGLKTAELLAIGQAAFEDYAPYPTAPTVALPPVHLHAQRIQEAIPRLQHCRLMLAWIGPDIRQLADAVALEMISTLLTTGRTSRLVKLLREERGLARNINSYFALQRDPGPMVIAAQPEAADLEVVEDLIRKELLQIQQGQISPEELDRARRMLRSEFIFGTETPRQTCALYGYYSTVAELGLIERYGELLNTVQIEDLQRVAQHYLAPEPIVLTFTPQG